MSNLTEDGLAPTPSVEDPAPQAQPVQETLPGVEATDTEAPQPIEPAPEPVDYLDIDDGLAAKHVKVTVDGEEVSVPLNEALRGYQRTADYTRKTQELAEQRRAAEEALQVQQAMQVNPGLTVQILAQRAGMSVEEYLGYEQTQQVATPEPVEYADPLEQALAEERQARLALQERIDSQDADRQLASIVNGMKREFGIDDSEAREAVRLTAQAKLDMSAIPLVYRAMAFDKQRAAAQAQGDAQAAQQAQDQQRQAAAAQASQVIGGGQSANGVTQASPSHKPTSTREAIEMAYQELDARQRR